MPYVKTTVNVPIPAEKREALKARLGKDIALLGKSESWLMVDFCADSPLYFKGSPDPAAMVSVDLYGAAGAPAYQRFTEAVTKLLGEQLNIPAGRVFIRYFECDTWGWNGTNL